MVKKSLEEITGICKEILGPQFNKIIDEYEREFQDFVVGTHQDIHNKFSQHSELEQDICSISVIHYLLFNQLCRAISNIESQGYWEDMFDHMREVGVGMCGDWAKLLKGYKEEK